MIDFFNLHPFYESSETLATITKGSTLQQIRMTKKIFTPYNRCQIFFFYQSHIFDEADVIQRSQYIFMTVHRVKGFWQEVSLMVLFEFTKRFLPRCVYELNLLGLLLSDYFLTWWGTTKVGSREHKQLITWS